MKPISEQVQKKVDQIIIENEMVRRGFAQLPYIVMKDGSLSLGARLTYAFLLMYAWQEESAFAGQKKMARDMGVSERTVQRFLYELRDRRYIQIERKDKRYNNTYIILDRKQSADEKRS